MAADGRGQEDAAMMSHGERRLLLLSQHDALRTLIRDLRAAVEPVLTGAQSETAPLRARIAVLQGALEAHLRAEEELLVPILERIDAEGPIRLELLRIEHLHQRTVLAILLSQQSLMMSPQTFAKRICSLARDLLEDMDAEEQDLLHSDVLRDDIGNVVGEK